MSTSDTWNSAVVSVDWRADRHSECHSIMYQRPTADNPNPKNPVVAGKYLNYNSLPMCSEWGRLFADIKVVDFDECSLTVMYGERTVVLNPKRTWVVLGRGGMSYTSFALSISIVYAEEEEKPNADEK